MAISAQGLQVSSVIVLRITVYVIEVKLDVVLWNEPTVLTVAFKVTITKLTSTTTDCYATILIAQQVGLAITYCYITRTAYRTGSSASSLINIREAVLHLYLSDKEFVRGFHSWHTRHQGTTKLFHSPQMRQEL